MSLRARGASTQVLLLHHSFAEARAMTQHMDDAAARSMGRMRLVRRIHSYLRARMQPPSMRWYAASTTAQVSALTVLSLSLARMSETLWPGLTSEGAAYFQDLTAPAVYLSPVATPFGTAGAVLPLACVLLYINAVDRSTAAHSPGMEAALKLLALPLFCMACLAPHALLLHWAAAGLWQVLLLAATAPGGPMAKLTGPPPMRALLAPASTDGGAVAAALSVADDAACLQHLAREYEAEGNGTAAAALNSRAAEVLEKHSAAATQATQVDVPSHMQAPSDTSQGNKDGKQGADGLQKAHV